MLKNTFDWTEFQALAWLPWLNQKARLLPDHHYKKHMSLIWTLLLVPVTGLLWFAYKGANSPSDKSKYGKVDKVVDGFIGDVTNYMASVGEFNYQGARGKLANVAQQIHQRFYTQLSEAYNECDEIQILAHSLGTVITYHALTGLLLSADDNSEGKKGIRPLEKLSRLYTIGSPLGKVRYFWPTTIKPDQINEILVEQDDTRLLSKYESGAFNFKWDNFFHKYDLISGRLKRFSDGSNYTLHSLKGGGGVIRSHVIYETSPQFLSVLTQGLFTEQELLKVSKWERFRDRVLSGVELLILPISIVLLSLIGLVFVLFPLFFVSAYFADLVVEDYGKKAGDVSGILFVSVMIIVLLIAWYYNTKSVAKDLHAKWTSKNNKRGANSEIKGVGDK